jgi:hypothetical protein
MKARRVVITVKQLSHPTHMGNVSSVMITVRISSIKRKSTKDGKQEPASSARNLSL